MIKKYKSLHNIIIKNCEFNTKLCYNINTNHITIGTTFQDRRLYYQNNKNKIIEKNKQYHFYNKIEINKQRKLDYKNGNLDYTEIGSEKFRIKISCLQQGIPINKFNGFTNEQKYCNLWTESFRQLVRDKYHNKCYLCDATKKDNSNRKLSVHHVNYDKNCLCQKTCEFVPLCSKCHSKTNFNRQYWEDLIMGYLYPNRYFIVDI